MSNAKHITINGRLPFNCIDPDSGSDPVYTPAQNTLRDWLCRMNTPTFGLRIHWTGPCDSRPSKHGGKTAIYFFSIAGTEAVSDAALDDLLWAIAQCEGEIVHKDIRECR